MANTKTSALAALSTVARGDLIPMVDVSNTTMAPTGTNVKVTADAFVNSMFPAVVIVGAPSGGDDSATIQAAMVTGRTTQLASGTYLVGSDLLPVANSAIQGAPDGSTIIKLTGTNRGFALTNIGHVTWRDLAIDCDKANTADRGDTTQNAFHILATNSTGCPGLRLERVTILNAWDRGVNAQATTLDTHPLEVDLIDVTISGCGLQGAFISKSTRTRVIRGDYSTSLYGLQVVGGRDPIIDGVRAHHNVDHGIVANTGVINPTIINCRAWNNGSTNDWGIVVGINATQFNVSNNWCWNNAGGMTIDVADTVANPIQGDGVIHGNICVDNTIGDGIHVNQVDGCTITGNVTARNKQDGLSIYGRHCLVDANYSHHNGRDGINFEEDLTSPLASCGAHTYGASNKVHDNNQNASTYKDFYVGNLTYGGVIDVARARALPLDIPSGEYVQLNPSAMSTAVVTNGTESCLPFDIAEPQTFDQLLFEVVTTPGSAGTSVTRGGIYYDNGTGRRPGRRREDLGTVATDSTGVKALTITNATFDVGRYWAVIVPQGSPAVNPTLRLVTSPFVRVTTTALATTAQEFLSTTGITGALADPHPTVNSTAATAVTMVLRAS